MWLKSPGGVDETAAIAGRPVSEALVREPTASWSCRIVDYGA
jgi:hypothetical protein